MPTRRRRALAHGTNIAPSILSPWIHGIVEVHKLRAGSDRLVRIDDLADGTFDVIVDAGPADQRFSFVTACWRFLAVDGELVLPDASRSRAIGVTLAIAFQFFREIDRIDIAPDGRDASVLHKCRIKPYVNWNKVEGRASWEVGDADVETTLRHLGVTST